MAIVSNDNCYTIYLCRSTETLEVENSMAGVIPNEGELQLCARIKASGTQKMILFKNNLTPVPGTVFANLTEANFSGYASGPVTWGTPFTDGAGKAVMIGTTITFTHNGGGTPNDIYGYAILTQDITLAWFIICAERLSSPPKVMTNNGDSITITPTFRGYNP